MAAEKTLGTTLVKSKSGSESTDTTIGYLLTIGEIGIESEEIDVTTLDSTGGFKEYIASFKDAGEVAITGLIEDEEAFSAMIALASSQALEEWTITTVSGSTWVFNAFVKSFKEGEVTVDGVRGFNGSLRVSGAPVYTSVSVSA